MFQINYDFKSTSLKKAPKSCWVTLTHVFIIFFSDIKNLYIKKYNPIWSKAANISNGKKLTDGSGEKPFVPNAQQLIHSFLIKLLLIKK